MEIIRVYDESLFVFVSVHTIALLLLMLVLLLLLVFSLPLLFQLHIKYTCIKHRMFNVIYSLYSNHCSKTPVLVFYSGYMYALYLCTWIEYVERGVAVNNINIITMKYMCVVYNICSMSEMKKRKNHVKYKVVYGHIESSRNKSGIPIYFYICFFFFSFFYFWIGERDKKDNINIRAYKR